jgi:arginine/lysine/ornithine decarboxylase
MPLHDAAGYVAAERISAYPPGVPLIVEGYQISQGQVDYLEEVNDAGGHLAFNGGRTDAMVAVMPRGTTSEVIDIPGPMIVD